MTQALLPGPWPFFKPVHMIPSQTCLPTLVGIGFVLIEEIPQQSRIFGSHIRDHEETINASTQIQQVQTQVLGTQKQYQVTCLSQQQPVLPPIDDTAYATSKFKCSP